MTQPCGYVHRIQGQEGGHRQAALLTRTIFPGARVYDSPRTGSASSCIDAPAAIVQDRKSKTPSRTGMTITVHRRRFTCRRSLPSFIDAYDDVKANRHIEYVFHGGRGSTKSSFHRLMYVYAPGQKPQHPRLCLAPGSQHSAKQRVLADRLGNHRAGAEDSSSARPARLRLPTCRPGRRSTSGRRRAREDQVDQAAIWLYRDSLVRGAGPVQGSRGRAQDRAVVLRGGDMACIFKSLQPAADGENWVNKYVLVPKANQLQHHSDLPGWFRVNG